MNFWQKIRSLFGFETTTDPKHIHLIAIGGAAMHNLALALHHNGFKVTGSDDEIYNPSRGRLEKYGLLPKEMGWHTERITKDIAVIIVGMHARKDNEELAKAKQLGLKILSYPEFVYQESLNKNRVVVAGSHGKTSTTAMILHVMNEVGLDTDYLVGAQLEGFETMVQLSNAPRIVLEGDEYLASPLVPQPKIHFYFPHIAIITGIAWDHINVFPTFENYVEQFEIFVNKIEKGGTLIWYEGDKHLAKIVENYKGDLNFIPYTTHKHEVREGITYLPTQNGEVPIEVFGVHNLQNLKAAQLVCRALKISDTDFYEAIKTFGGAAKRLQRLVRTANSVAYLDFAHAPSKAEATINAVKEQFPNRKLVACFELHTFSSLNKDFLSQYKGAMNAADEAYVYFSEHTLKMKRLPIISKEEVAAAFQHPNIKVFTDNEDLVAALKNQTWTNQNLLMMSSGNFGKLDVKSLAKSLLT